MDHDEIMITPPVDEIERFSVNEIEKFKLLDEVDQAPFPLNKPLIQMVPQILRSCYGKEDCERYFKPTSVVIGPLNRSRETELDSRFERGKKWKLKLAAMFVQFCESPTKDLYKNVKENLNYLKNCYNSREVEESEDEELAWMFLVDGCALLQFIALDVSDSWQEFSFDNDVVCIEKVDFFLLENQLPYQLLEILIDSIVESSNVELREITYKELLKKCITEFINKSALSLIGPQQQHQIQVDKSQPHPQEQQENEKGRPHLLDLLRRRLMGEKGEKQERINKDVFWKTVNDDKGKHSPSIRNVKELKDRGICFKAREKGGAITGIDFKDGCCTATLTLAPIVLHSTTVRLLLNLTAYELCPDFKENCEITSHLSFLDSLIDSGEDVKELRDVGVLHSELGSDNAVAELFNKISGILVPNPTMHSKLKHRIHKYCQSYKSRFGGQGASIKARIIHIYTRSPWIFLVFLSALAGLIMTGMQTYYSFRENKLRS